jgi:hypothetical protein
MGDGDAIADGFAVAADEGEVTVPPEPPPHDIPIMRTRPIAVAGQRLTAPS